MESLIPLGAIALAVTFLLAKKISGNLFWGFLAITFFLPFERVPTLELGDFTAKINHLVGAVFFVFWLLDLAFNRRKIRPNPTILPILFLVFSFVLPVLDSPPTSRSIVFFILNLFVIAIFLATVQIVDSKDKLAKISKILAWSSGLVALFGFYQFFGDFIGLPTWLDPGYTRIIFGFPRIHAFSREPLYLGNYLLLPLSVGFAHFLSGKLKRSGWSPLLLLGLATIFVLTLSRGAYLALFAGFLVFAIFYAKQIFTPRNIAVVGVTAILALGSVALVLEQIGPGLLDKFIAQATVQDFGRSESTQGRLVAYQVAIEAWHTSPWVGVGLGNYGLFTAFYNESSAKVADIVNNQYLELLAETGIVGLSSFLLFCLVIAWRFFIAISKADSYFRPWLIALFAAFVGTLVQYNFFSTLAIIHIWVTLGLLVAVEQLAITSRIANKRE